MDETSAILNGFRMLVQGLQLASRSSERRVGLSGAQVFVLQKLSQAETLTVNELAERTHTHQSTVSIVVSKLAGKGLISRVRSKADARVQLLRLTAAGRKKLERSPDTVQDRLMRAIQALQPIDRRELCRLLYTVLEGSGLGHIAPTFFFENKSFRLEKSKKK